MNAPRLSLFALAAVLSACGPTEASPQRAAGPAPEVPLAPGTRVEVAVVGNSDANLVLELPGEVEGAREAFLAASLGGFVESVHVEEGQTVSEGQLLAEVDTSLRAVGVEQAQAQLAQAKDELARVEAMGDLGTPARLTSARTQVTLADASLRQAQIQLDRTRIRAPFAGVIAKRDMDPGEVASPGSPAFRLVQLNPAVVNLSVSDRDVLSLKVGMDVRISTDARLEPVAGKLARILPTSDMKTRTFTVEVEVPNPDHTLLPGMIATALIEESVASDKIVLPQDFLVTRIDGLGVYIEVDGKAVWRPVTVSSMVRDQAIIGQGLAPGDRVVVTGHRDLAPGDALLLAREGTCCTAGRATF